MQWLFGTPRGLLLLAFLASAASLALAFISEYGFGLKPCELCIFQRIPYGVVMALALLGLWKTTWARALCVLVALCFLVDGGIAFYHAGVEKKWFPGPEACTDQGGDKPLSLEEILAKIQNAPIVACDQPQWEWHGFTMAGLNAIWAFTLAGGMMAALQKQRRREQNRA